MTGHDELPPVSLTIFGGAGDLTQRKLVPSLFNLSVQGRLPDRYAVFGVDRKQDSTEAWRDRLRAGMATLSDQGAPTPEAWEAFAAHLAGFVSGDFTSQDTMQALAKSLDQTDRDQGARADRIFYLATPPDLVQSIVKQLSAAGLIADRDRSRVVFEKPFGHDLQSARAINRALLQDLEEPQIYRIDHYLGKETVQNILALRFANALFEPIWDRRYIDQVQITIAERVGIGHRGDYYEQAGALRDMVQSHLLQILCLIAMEPPAAFDADEIRARKVDILQAIRPITADQVEQFSARGQYGPGAVDGKQVKGYRAEADVAADSTTATYAALKLFVDNWRWQDVPFYLRTGKRLPRKVSQVHIVFRPVPHRSFPDSAARDWRPNRVEIDIQPKEGIALAFEVKQPGPDFVLRAADLQFRYADEFGGVQPEAYETLLLDVMRGDPTLFMRADQVEAAWAVVDPVLSFWEDKPPEGFPNYPAGSWGPDGANRLIEQDARAWVQPSGS